MDDMPLENPIPCCHDDDCPWGWCGDAAIGYPCLGRADVLIVVGFPMLFPPILLVLMRFMLFVPMLLVPTMLLIPMLFVLRLLVPMRLFVPMLFEPMRFPRRVAPMSDFMFMACWGGGLVNDCSGVGVYLGMLGM